MWIAEAGSLDGISKQESILTNMKETKDRPVVFFRQQKEKMKLNQRHSEETMEAREGLEVKGRECGQDCRDRKLIPSEGCQAWQ